MTKDKETPQHANSIQIAAVKQLVIFAKKIQASGTTNVYAAAEKKMHLIQ